MPDPTEDDTRALRADGDFPTYLRSLIRPTTRTTNPTPATPISSNHTPGAWPHRTHPPTSQICRPTCPCATPPPA